jgi:beta-glucanase (GH16 family)
MLSSPSSGVGRHISKNLLSALAMGALCACAHPSPAALTPTRSDEFNGPAGAPVDTTFWRYDTGDGCTQNNCGWGNTEREYYTSDTANIALNGEGQLKIVARVAPAGLSCYYGACHYTSAKITTRDKVSVTAGRVEARIKLAAGQGLWPALWMLGSNIGAVGWPTSGELDIMENRGSNTHQMSSAVHGPGYSGDTPLVHAQQAVTTDYHVYAVDWDDRAIRFSVDGSVHYLVERTAVQRYGNWVFDQPFFIILNQAVGGHFDGNPQSDAIFPATMLVDYVRIYSKAGAK